MEKLKLQRVVTVLPVMEMKSMISSMKTALLLESMLHTRTKGLWGWMEAQKDYIKLLHKEMDTTLILCHNCRQYSILNGCVKHILWSTISNEKSWIVLLYATLPFQAHCMASACILCETWNNCFQIYTFVVRFIYCLMKYKLLCFYCFWKCNTVHILILR